MSQTFHIPQPCHESWDQMTPGEQGRHCAACNKMVMDFTDWSTDEIAAYLYARSQHEVCGRFRQDQVQQDAPVIQPQEYIYQLSRSGLSLLRRIAALILLVFCTSSMHAQTRPTGLPVVVNQGKVVSIQQQPVKVKEQPDVPRTTVGMVAMPVKKTDTTSQTVKGRVAPTHRRKK